MIPGPGPGDWDRLYAQIVCTTGWSWDQVDALTMPRYRALLDYWRDYPPVPLLLRALLGFKPNVRGGAPGDNAPLPFARLVALAPDGLLSAAALNRL